MKTKTIWMLAVLFGSLATGMFYLLVMPTDAPAVQTTPVPQAEAEAGTQPEKRKALMEISPTMRAISVPVNDSQGVAGHIQAGDFVDVIMTSPTKMDPLTGQLLLQNVKVLALGHAAVPTPENMPIKEYRMVTLEVTASQGVSLGLAVQNQAGIYLMLRPPGASNADRPIHLPLEKLIREGVPK